MDTKQKITSARAEIFKALAHPSRLTMVEQLADGEMCVAELTELVGADMSTVSKHLSVLKNCGVVQTRKKGLQVFYSLAMPCVIGFFQCLDAVLLGHVQAADQIFHTLDADTTEQA